MHVSRQGGFLKGVLTLTMFFAGIAPASASPYELPRLSMDQMQYQGAFRVPNGEVGSSGAGSSSGVIGLNPTNNTLLLVGHVRDQALAEFAIPALSASLSLGDLNLSQMLQPFSDILDRPDTGNPQDIDRIGGMLFHNGRLIVNGYQFYDASSSVSHTTLVIDDPTDIAGSGVRGYYSFDVDAHAANWLSDIPEEWQAELGGTHLAGASSGNPILTRWPVGPSAFVFDPNNIGSTTTLLDFSMDNPLNGDYYNSSRENDIWTHKSKAVYGFVVPGTRTYMTFGRSGGHVSGIGYKITQSDGNVCGGYCTYDAEDNQNFYWLWDVEDLVKVKNGQMQASAVRPYDYGVLQVPFSDFDNLIGGASYDQENNLLYVTVEEADNSTQYMRSPVVLVYRVGSKLVKPGFPLNIRTSDVSE